MTIKRVCLYSRTYFIEWLQMFLPTFYLEEAIKQDSKHGLYTTVNHFSILRLETAQYWDLRLTASVSGDCSESHSRDGGNNYIQIGRSLAPTQFWAFYPLELQVSVVCPRLPPHLHHFASTLRFHSQVSAQPQFEAKVAIFTVRLLRKSNQPQLAIIALYTAPNSTLYLWV